MDKYEYNIKAEQIVKLIGKKDFVTAAKIADGIDWKRVRNINMLMNVGGVYAEVGRYSDAKEILLMAFDRAPIGRRLAYKLTEVCILAGDFEEAEHYYGNFVDLAPRDIGRYELQYKMAKKKGEPIEKLIAILQEYKKNDFDDAWAYELARLYHKAGMRDACIAECDELILWFGEGEYVEKAMELKMLYTPLSLSQQEKYNKRFQPQMKYDEAQVQAAASAQVSDVTEQLPQQPVSVSLDMYNTANIQAALAESMKELMEDEEAGAQQEAEAFAVRVEEEPTYAEQSVVAYAEQNVMPTQAVSYAEQPTVQEQAVTYTAQPVVEEQAEEVQTAGEPVCQTSARAQEPTYQAASSAQEQSYQTATTPQTSDMLGATKDLRNVHRALAWNNMEPGLREEEALNLNEQIEGQMTIDEVLAMYNQKLQESVEASKESIFHIVAKGEAPEDVLPDELLDTMPKSVAEHKEAAEEPAQIVMAEEIPVENDQKQAESEYEFEEPRTALIQPKKKPVQQEVEEPEQPSEAKAQPVQQMSEEAKAQPVEMKVQPVQPVTVPEVDEEDEEEEAPRTGIKAEIDKMMKEMEVPVQRNGASGQLSEERKQSFAAFLHINGLEEQLAEIFDEAERIGEEKDTSLFGNVLIIGDHKSGKTTLATELMKNLNKTTSRKGRKIAKISGDRLNNKGIKETIAHLIGADLLVERAGEMNRTTTQELLNAMAGFTGGMLVVLEDTNDGMARLIAENPEVEVRFTHKIILKEYEISEWVALAKEYAEELDYGIDEMGVLALSAKIDSLYAQKTVVDMEDIKDIIDAAIEHSERKNIKRLFETVFSRKYKDSDLTMLRENDFL